MKEDIEAIKERNKKVEADKAWETSVTRRSIITFLTYIIVVIFLYAINSEYPLLLAFIPAIGYFLSTLSLSFVKKWWMTSLYKK